MKKVLFVCLGNICRSPLAEALFIKHVKDAGLQDKYMADSCGTAAFHTGEQPDGRSKANARENGFDYSHQARKLNIEDFSEYEFIIPMDASNMANIEKANPGGIASVQLMRDYDFGFEGSNVPDPYFGGDQGFQDVFDILNRSTKSLLDHLEGK